MTKCILELADELNECNYEVGSDNCNDCIYYCGEGVVFSSRQILPNNVCMNCKYSQVIYYKKNDKFYSVAGIKMMRCDKFDDYIRGRELSCNYFIEDD
jgi:hypothetical protein